MIGQKSSRVPFFYLLMPRDLVMAAKACGECVEPDLKKNVILAIGGAISR